MARWAWAAGAMWRNRRDCLLHPQAIGSGVRKIQQDRERRRHDSKHAHNGQAQHGSRHALQSGSPLGSVENKADTASQARWRTGEINGRFGALVAFRTQNPHAVEALDGGTEFSNRPRAAQRGSERNLTSGSESAWRLPRKPCERRPRTTGINFRPLSWHAYGLERAERTLEQDPTFAFRIIIDIALRALSAAINDPTTAVLAIDQLHRLLRLVGKRHLRTDEILDSAGELRVVFRTPN